MKRIIIICLSLILLLACVPTPKQDAVKQKDTNVLIDSVRAAESEGESSMAEPSAAPFEAPERFVCDFVIESSKTHVTADVPVRVLFDGSFPMLRAEHGTWSETQRLALAKRLTGSENLYIWEYRMTKEQLEALIAEYMEEPSPKFKSRWMDEDPENTEEAWQVFLAERKQYAEMYQEQYRSMPDVAAYASLASWNGSLPKAEEDHLGWYVLVPEPNPTAEQWAYDRVNVSSSDSNGISYESANKDMHDHHSAFEFAMESRPGVTVLKEDALDTPQGDAAITAREAAKLALAYVDGFGSFALESVLWSNNKSTEGEIATGGDWAYVVRMTPVYNGAQLVYCQGGAGSYTETTVESWPYESAEAVVDGTGRLIAFAWNGSPHRISETISESAPMLPFAEIQEIFERQMRNKFAYNEGHFGLEFEVKEVKLGLFRIREKNSFESGLFVPVWFFTGAFTDGSQQYDSLNPLLIINAIDGTIIDPYRGY